MNTETNNELAGVRMPGNPVELSGYDDPAVRVGAPDLNQHGAATSQQDRLTRGNTE